MKREDAVRIVTNCAKEYHKNLENRNLLFLLGYPLPHSFLESVFLPRHFLHLTGLEMQKNRMGKSSDFYERALKGRLSPGDFSFSKDGTTNLKLTVLPSLMKLHRSAKMAGDYDGSRPTLFTKKLVGTVVACMGFVWDGDYYVPNTALKEDIRNIVSKPQQRVLAVFRKDIRQPVYREVCCLAKGILLQNLVLPEALREKILLPIPDVSPQNEAPPPMP